MSAANFWHWVVTSRYTRALEEEVARLRAENRALVNSLLGTAGVPPLAIHEAALPGSAEGKSVVPAVRRRSWQQIGRMLEMEDARRERTIQPPAAKG
jgi:hypothetical protein